jgi:hypothetical protein
VNCLKNNFEIYIKINIEITPTCFGAVTPSSFSNKGLYTYKARIGTVTVSNKLRAKKTCFYSRQREETFIFFSKVSRPPMGPPLLPFVDTDSFFFQGQSERTII